MELTEVMRTTFAAREFTVEPIPGATLYRILDNARFAPSGGNRQGWQVIIVREESTRRRLSEMMIPTVQQYLAQTMAGEVPYNTVNATKVTAKTIEQTPVRFPLIENLHQVPVVLVVCVDLARVTSFDAKLARVGVISGASIYPFVWNILLSARNEGYGGVLTTFLAASEPAAKQLLNIPHSYAIASMVPLGRPVKQLTKLTRNPVESFTHLDQFDGDALNP